MPNREQPFWIELVRIIAPDFWIIMDAVNIKDNASSFFNVQISQLTGFRALSRRWSARVYFCAKDMPYKKHFPWTNQSRTKISQVLLKFKKLVCLQGS